MLLISPKEVVMLLGIKLHKFVSKPETYQLIFLYGEKTWATDYSRSIENIEKEWKVVRE